MPEDKLGVDDNPLLLLQRSAVWCGEDRHHQLIAGRVTKKNKAARINHENQVVK